MSKKKKLKKKIKLLRRQLYELTFNPNSVESTLIKSSIRLQDDMEKVMMFGELKMSGKITGKNDGIQIHLS